MNIIEISPSIQGELPLMGQPCLIIRLEGCNLKCPYCDAPDKAEFELEIDEIVDQALQHGINNILLTGGEPLIAPGIKFLLNSLQSEGFRVLLETNGTIPLDISIVANTAAVVMDVKLFKDDFKIEEANLRWLDRGDAIKFVYRDDADLQKASTFIATYSHKISTDVMIIFSPVNVKEPLFNRFMQIAQTYPERDIRLQCQIHKVLEVR